MRNVNRIIALILAFVLTFSCVPGAALQAHAAEAVTLNAEPKAAEPTISVEYAWGEPGTTVNVHVSFENNPGILAAELFLNYDPALELIGLEAGEAFDGIKMTRPGKFVSGCKVIWDGADPVYGNGRILTMTFLISEDAEVGKLLPVSVVDGGFVSQREGDNEPYEIETTIVSNCVNIIDYTPGDVNDDGTIDVADVILLRRAVAGGYDVTINNSAANVNEDGKISSMDIVQLRRYLAGGYGTVLKPVPVKCDHSLTGTEAKDATCTESGNIAYWRCDKCGQYFSDAAGKTAIPAESIVVDALGHDEVIDEGYPPKNGQPGKTEGKHCDRCGEVLVPQIDIWPDQYTITYVVADSSDPYLMSLYNQGKIENPNRPVYAEDEKFELLNLNVPGYKFEGWYDVNNNRVGIIENRTGNFTLYAKWTKITYTVTYESDMVPIIGEANAKYLTYTTDTGKEALPKPNMDKYTFIGWSDKDGNLWNSIPVGYAGDLTLYANWVSERNMAKAVPQLGEPLIMEDSEKGLILFAYEIGTIENVPLFTTLKLQCVNGLISTIERTEETSISTEQAESVAKVIANATTNSASWTLESNWNNTTEVSQTELDQMEITREEAEKMAMSQNNTYNVGTSFGGSVQNTKTNTGSFTLTGNKSHSDTTTVERGQEVDLSVDGKYSSEKSLGLSLGAKDEAKGLSAGLTAGKKSSWEIGVGADYKQHKTTTNSGTDSWSVGAEVSNEVSKSKTAEKNWNTDVGFSSSSTVSYDKEVSMAVSSLISTEKQYGQSYAEGGSNEESQAFETNKSESDEFSSTFTYYNSEIKSTTTSFSSTGNTTGDYRLVMAGTVHVFAVVGYDVANSSYFVYTYNVLDEKTEEYLDYSFDGSFSDYETSIIPFEVPVFVNDYVNNRIAETAGLECDPDTNVYTNYTPDAEEPATIISVPSYHVVEKGDGTFDSVKVAGISSELFQNNTEITGVILGHHITEIPDNAFAGCTNLRYVICPGVTKIGNNAFDGCVSLNTFTVSEEITSVGRDAFRGVPEIVAVAADATIAKNIAESGALKITLDMGVVPEEQLAGLSFHVDGKKDNHVEGEDVIYNIDTFELRGKDRTYPGLVLKSEAVNTVINGVNITNGTGISLNLTSENVTLNRVSVDTAGYAMLLSAPTTNIILGATNTLKSAGGNTVVSRSIALSGIPDNTVDKLIVDGKVLYCGTLTGEKYLTCDEAREISEEEYLLYSQGVVCLTLDANGGEVDVADVIAYCGNPVGTLPVPTRDYYTFLGWYTEAEGGEQVTADTVVTSPVDMTLYAHWELNPVQGWVKASELPEGAEVVEQKWSYTERETTTSTATSLDGYNRVSKEWIQNGSGSKNYASFPSGFYTSHSYYQNLMKSPYAASETETAKRTVSNSWAGYIYWHWMYNVAYSTSMGRQIADKKCSNDNGSLAFHYFYAIASSTNCPKAAEQGYVCGYAANKAPVTYNCKDILPKSTSTTDGMGTPRMLRFDYYTSTYTDYYALFTYERYVDKESSTEVYASDSISNVVEWVTYRMK